MLKKKWFQALSVFIVLITLSLAAVPFLFDVDKYRPQILSKVNENINGELKLEKISLSLWGNIKFGLEGLQLLDAKGKEVITTDDSHASIPFWSLITFKPNLSVILKGPAITVHRDKDGAINLAKLIKEKKDATPIATKDNGKESEGSNEEARSSLDSLKDARVSFYIKDGVINLTDEKMDLKQNIEGFNLNAKNLGLNSENHIVMSTSLKTKMDQITADGDINLDLRVTPTLHEGSIQKVENKISFNLDKVAIKYGDLFEKSKDIPLNLKSSVSYDLKNKKAVISDTKFIFHNATIDINAEHLDNKTKLSIASNKVDLKSWPKLIPLATGISGSAQLNGEVSQAKDLSYDINIALNDISAKLKDIPSDLKLNSKVHVITNEVKSFSADLKAKDNDISITGSLKDFERPNIKAQVRAASIDLDQILPKSVTATPTPAEKKVAAVVNKSPTKDAATNPDAAIQEAKKNPMLAKISAHANVKITKFKGMGATAKNINADISFKNLKASINNIKAEAYDGKILGLMEFDLKPKKPSYKLGLGIHSMNLSKASSAHMPEFKDTLFGKLSFKVASVGSGLDPNNIIKTLRTKGDFEVSDAILQTVDVIKATKDALQSSVKKLSKIIPKANLSSLNKLKDEKSKYQKISSNFSLKDGVLSMPNFVGIAVKNRGLDIKGKTEVNLINSDIKADWTVIDTYDRTHAQDISVKVAGTEISNVLADKKGLVSLPIIVGCKLSKPCYKFDKVLKTLEKRATSNIKKKGKKIAKDKIKSKVKAKTKKLESKLKKKTKEKLKGALKKFGF